MTLVAVLLASPLSIADVGLWLTFGATAAIVAGASSITLPRVAWLRAPAAMVLASLAAETALIPIVAYVFQRVTIAGLAVNLVAIPCMAVVQIAAMVDGGSRRDWPRIARERGRLGNASWRPRSTGERAPRRLRAVADVAGPVAGACGDRWRTTCAVVVAVVLNSWVKPATSSPQCSCCWIVAAPPTLARGCRRRQAASDDDGCGARRRDAGRRSQTAAR